MCLFFLPKISIGFDEISTFLLMKIFTKHFLTFVFKKVISFSKNASFFLHNLVNTYVLFCFNYLGKCLETCKKEFVALIRFIVTPIDFNSNIYIELNISKLFTTFCSFCYELDSPML